jgi:hypothetical protein
MKIRPTHEVRQEALDSTELLNAGYKFGDGPRDLEDRILANIDGHRHKQRARKQRAAAIRAMPMSSHRRANLEGEQRALLRAARSETSPALCARYLADAKRIADQLAADAFCQKAAAQLRVSKKTIERAVNLGSRLLPDLAQAIARTPFDNPADLARLAALTVEEQHNFAKAAANRRHELLLVQGILADGRLRRLDHETIDWLERLGRNDSQTRRCLAAMPQRAAIETVARWQREHDEHERRTDEINRLREQARAAIRTTARQTAQAAYDAMTTADKADFLEVNGLTRAPVIRGECISNAFDAVDETELAQ